MPAGWQVSDSTQLSYGQALLTKIAPEGGQPPNDTSVLLGRLDLKLFAGAETDNTKAAQRLASDMGEFFMPFPGTRVNQETVPLDAAGMPGVASYYEVKFTDTNKPDRPDLGRRRRRRRSSPEHRGASALRLAGSSCGSARRPTRCPRKRPHARELHPAVQPRRLRRPRAAGGPERTGTTAGSQCAAAGPERAASATGRRSGRAGCTRRRAGDAASRLTAEWRRHPKA